MGLGKLVFFILLLTLHLFRHFGGHKWINSFMISLGQKKNIDLRIDSPYPSITQLNYEQEWKLKSQWIDLAIMGLCFLLYNKSSTLIYIEIQKYGIPYLLLSFFILLFLQDTYFYFTHRMLHIPFLYKKIHQVHHKSKAPSTNAAFSHHPAEKFIELLFYPLIILIIPLHPGALITFLTYSTITNFIGHSGFEIRKIPSIGKHHNKYMATTVFHEMHHRYPNKNFGLYLTFWDRLLSSTDKKYEGRLSNNL